MTKRDLVLVEWLDSASNNKWRRVEELVAEGTTLMQCKSVGWLIVRTKRAITIAAHLSGGHDDYREHASGDITIPMGCVTKIKKLRE